MPRTLIVIPTYNEKECLPAIVPAVRAAVPEATLLIVDDGSPDGTGALADELAAADPQVRVMHRAAKQGLGAAYLAAFQRALGEPDGWERLVQMDADFSHEPRDVPRLLAALDAGADLAIGSRYVDGGGTENWGLGRRIISRGGGLYARSVLGVGIQDLTAGFKAWRADHAARDQARRRVGQGLRLPDRDDLPRAAQRASAWTRFPSASSTAASVSRRCRGRSSSRR